MPKEPELKEVLHILRKEPYVSAIGKLREMGVLHKHVIQTELGEWVAYKLFGGQRMGSAHPVYDLVTPSGKTVKARTHYKEEMRTAPWSAVGQKHADIYIIFLLKEDVGLEKALGGTRQELQASGALRLERKHGPRLHWTMMPELTPEKAKELGAADVTALQQWKSH
ncbi:MAG TPA: hypothetical protein P5079_05200 [Elusimicrobiota bacterium]|nr:hypothetical protein [Elusimicrobiota bacterium]